MFLKKSFFLTERIIFQLFLFVSCLLLSSPYWFPIQKLTNSFYSLQKTCVLFLDPKWLFIVSNFIIIILIGTMNVTRGGEDDMQRIELLEKAFHLNEDTEYYSHNMNQYSYGRKREQEEGKGTEQNILLPTEELNKRAENLIARMNSRRWLEARLVDCNLQGCNFISHHQKEKNKGS
ncbi:hypothetical protein LIER_26388 [Lithospermum erythrorhizon]|uniref:DUF4408 domain-containing protein n=1 Tax=Lithospermum erythrorhizon TaxID=34254 RepID=A0AAV3R9Q0_LITER